MTLTNYIRLHGTPPQYFTTVFHHVALESTSLRITTFYSLLAIFPAPIINVMVEPRRVALKILSNFEEFQSTNSF